jgi:2,4-dienoyl-CoA reductase-like NADH-dependent reductase (Old Yellow Enzyme family)
MSGLKLRKTNDFIRKIWSPRPLISAGGYTRELAIDTAETKGDLIAVGRLFISNVRINASALLQFCH